MTKKLLSRSIETEEETFLRWQTKMRYTTLQNLNRNSNPLSKERKLCTLLYIRHILVVKTGNLSAAPFSLKSLQWQQNFSDSTFIRASLERDRQSHLKGTIMLLQRTVSVEEDYHFEPIKCVFKYCDFKVRYSIELCREEEEGRMKWEERF